jgi:hypothetical protein
VSEVYAVQYDIVSLFVSCKIPFHYLYAVINSLPIAVVQTLQLPAV